MNLLFILLSVNLSLTVELQAQALMSDDGSSAFHSYENEIKIQLNTISQYCARGTKKR
jgi:hypothetical protein